VNGVKVTEELAEITTLEKTDPMHGKFRIVTFRMDEIGEKHRLTKAMEWT
jgi:hypothetical protein